MPRLTLDQTAATCYEAVRGLNGDNRPTWKNLPREKKDAVVEEVKQLRAGVTHEAAHIAWSTDELRGGTNPDELTAYADLPAARHIEDELYAAIVRTLAAH